MELVTDTRLSAFIRNFELVLTTSFVKEKNATVIWCDKWKPMFPFWSKKCNGFLISSMEWPSLHCIGRSFSCKSWNDRIDVDMKENWFTAFRQCSSSTYLLLNSQPLKVRNWRIFLKKKTLFIDYHYEYWRNNNI